MFLFTGGTAAFLPSVAVTFAALVVFVEAAMRDNSVRWVDWSRLPGDWCVSHGPRL
ncbi:MAG: hypothetical protein KDA93_20630 [Planctomycetaceae bacterium]|nr:hypothetical protein [Planctomycetaceae bacterium]